MHAADTLPTAKSGPIAKREESTALILRNDTMLGVCTGIGQEFGISPNYLRVAIASLFLVSFKFAIGLYLALGLALFAARLIFPSRRRPVAEVAVIAVEANDVQAAPQSIAA